jgi:UrcA family protein
MITSARVILAATIFAALTCSIATVSFASDRLDVLQVKVQYGDLDVSSASGAATLYNRIRGAADTVCHPLKDPSIYPRRLFYICMKKAISNAVNDANEPVLFAVANAKAGTITPKVIVTSSAR